jgi:hypothetical protein
MVNGKKDLNNFTLNNLEFLTPGIYSVTIYYENNSLTQRMLKMEYRLGK